jgi:phosphatidylglycerophosphatase A
VKFEQPNWPRQLPPSTVLNVATLGPIGERLPAPGTWGSAAGVVFFFVCFTQLGLIEFVVIGAAMAYLAVGICGQAEIQMETRDPKEVIFDEFVSMPLCFFGWRMITGTEPLAFLGLMLAGFLLFRLFDIWKPLVIDKLQALPGGWGIVLDDTAAALATCLTLHIAHAVWMLAHHSAGPVSP